MSDAESGMSGDEDSAISDNEEKSGPSEPVKAPGFHAPTTQELVELREGSELFQSNSFKLQLEQLLREVSASECQ
ncbi:hypothetical protein FRC11_011412 [Ceratobasidium sp. 423]|nr:hypothetical protein FRC11_011412 [Ceratobasidium sp. 423]